MRTTFHGYTLPTFEERYVPWGCTRGYCWHAIDGVCPHVQEFDTPNWVYTAHRRYMLQQERERLGISYAKESTRFTHNHATRVAAKDADTLVTFREQGDKDARYRNNEAYGHAWRRECRGRGYISDEQAIAEGLEDMRYSQEEFEAEQQRIDWDAESDWITWEIEDEGHNDRMAREYDLLMDSISQEVDEDLVSLMSEMPHGAPIRTGSWNNIAYAA